MSKSERLNRIELVMRRVYTKDHPAMQIAIRDLAFTRLSWWGQFTQQRRRKMNAATATDIRGWLEEAKAAGATHMIVVCDDFDYSDYPVFVTPEQDVNERAEYFRNASMQRVMEVYSFTGKHSIDDQMNELRAFHYD